MPGDGLLSDKTVLLVEDEVMVAMLIMDMLAEAGCKQVHHAATRQQALELIDRKSPDFAILDINLVGERSFQIADALRARGTPLVFATGYTTQGIPPEWTSVPILNKPFSAELLNDAVVRAFRDA